MTDGLGVRPPDLVTHAGHVEAIAAQVTTAAGAGATARPGPDAYGTLCAMVPLMLGTLHESVIEGIQTAAKALEDTGARLRTAAESYAATDERRSQALLRIRNSM